jgi:hypothetical protein
MRRPALSPGVTACRCQMKTKIMRCFVSFIALLAAVNLYAQGSAFTYQGRLNTSSGPATGTYDFAFTIYDSAFAGSTVAGPVTNSAVSVSNGLFTTTIDFGGAVFNGSSRWMEIAVRTNGSTTETFFTLSPRQAFTPTPYSITAGSISGPVPASQLSGSLPTGNLSGTYNNQLTLNNPLNKYSGTYQGDGTAISNVNAATLNGVASSNLWQTGGNNVANGQFIGSTNNAPVEIRANNQTALRITPTPITANIQGGWQNNSIDADVQGSVIAGGGTANYIGFIYANRVASDYSSIGGGAGNWIAPGAEFSLIGSGWRNTIWSNSVRSVIDGGVVNVVTNGSYAFIGGGLQNLAIGQYATIPGGTGNTAGSGSTVAGGEFNAATNSDAAVGGGRNNVAGGSWSAVAGGAINKALSVYSAIGGGTGNLATNNYATVPGGYNNVAGGLASLASGSFANATNDNTFVWSDGSAFASTGIKQFLVHAAGGVGINTNNPNGSALNVLGNVNATSFTGAFTGNGASLSNVNATTIGGVNSAGLWQLGGNNVSAGQFIGSTNNQPFEVRANNKTVLLISPGTTDSPNIKAGSQGNTIDAGVQGSVISGGGTTNLGASPNHISADLSTIGGGTANTIGVDAFQSTIAGGYGNVVYGMRSVIGGGAANASSNQYATIAGGQLNYSTGYNSFIGAGSGNRAFADYTTVSGGYVNVASNTYATVGGGFQNIATGASSTIPGGNNNTAAGDYSFAAGRHATANNQGAFVWADSQNANFSSTANDQFLIRAQGGVGINTNNPNGASLSVTGNRSGGFATPVAYFENSNSNNASPALRVLGNGNPPDGVLSVSSSGTGLIARFGNSSTWVADITTNGTIDATAFNGGSVRIGNSGTTISTLQAGQAIMPGSSTVSTNFSITFPQAFTATPKVIASISGDPGFPNATDVFALTVRGSISTTGFTVNVMRLDTPGGWSQQLRINWQAWQ